MKKAILLAAFVAVGAALATTAPVLAWHPQVDITKYVQNVTAGGAKSDANTNGDAVQVKPGDTIKYVIEIKNPAAPADNNWNDLYYTVMTDDLPAGVELVGNPGQRKITENIGVILPGAKVTKEYTLTVTSTTDGAFITNKVCVDGDSKVKDTNPKPHDCDNAVIKVKKPEEPKTPETPKTPEVLPSTGPEAFIGTGVSVTALGYGIVAFARSKRK